MHSRRGPGEKSKTFDGYACHDLESKLWGVRDLIKELDEPDPTLVGLEETLDRALALHIAVAFDQ